MTETDERLAAIEAKLDRIEEAIGRFCAVALPVLENPGKLLGKLMGGRG